MKTTRYAPPRLVSSLVEQALKSLGFAGEVDLRKINAVWPKVVGEPTTAFAKPTGIKNGILRVEVTSPVWSVELGYLKDEIVARLNTLIGEDLVTEIRFFAGEDDE